MLMLAGAATAHAVPGLSITSPVSGAYINDTTPLVQYSGSAGGLVQLRADNAPVGTANWPETFGSVTPDAPISAGTSDVVLLTVVDGMGASAPVAVTVNQVPSFGVGDEFTTHDGDTVTNERISFDVTGAIPGTDSDEPQSTYIRLHTYNDDGPTSDSTFAADLTGAAKDISPSGPDLQPGEHTAYLTTQDADGVESAKSEEVTFTVAEAPAEPEFKDLFNGVQLNQSQPELKLTGIDPDATKVTLYHVVTVDGTGKSVELPSSAVIDAVNGTATVTPTHIADGMHSISVTQTARGVETGDDNRYPTPVTVHVNTSAPVLDKDFDGELTNEVPWLHVEGALESYGNGDNTNTVEFYIDGALAGTDTTDGGGNAGIHPEDVADGVHTAYAVTRDDLGHLSSVRSNEVTFTLDTTAPASPTFLSPGHGAVLTNGLPMVTVRAEPGSRVVFIVDYAGESGSVTTDSDGNASFQVTEALTDGAHTVSALAIDAADNSDNDSAVFLTFTVKVPVVSPPVPPVVSPPVVSPPVVTPPATTPAAPSKVKLSSGTLTNAKPVTVAFTLKKAATVRVSITKTVKGKTVTIATVNVKYKKGGSVTYKLKTKVGGKTLKKGKYNVTLETVDGKKKSKSASAKVTVR